MIKFEAEKLGVDVPTVFIGIGDNPKADIRGARSAGEHWRSVLVRTGVFTGEDNDPVDVADFVFDNVESAIDFFIEDREAWNTWNRDRSHL